MKNYLIAATLLFSFLCISFSAPVFAATTAKAPEKKYKSVEATSPSSNNFRGEPAIYGQEFFVGLGVNYFDSFGIQTRYAHRLLEEGFIEDFNDALYFEGGIGLVFYGTVKNNTGVTGVPLLATARWDFLYDRSLTLFGNIGFGFNPVINADNSDVDGGGFFPAVGVGAIYNVSSTIGVRFDLSYQFLGIGMLARF